MRTPFSPHGFSRAVSLHLSAFALIFLGMPGLLSAQTLEHRYSFISDASDSVGGSAWNGTLVNGTSGINATIDNGLMLPGNSSGGGQTGYVSLPNGIIKGDTNITVECWVQASSVNTWAEIWDFGSSGSVNFALIQDSPTPNSQMRVAFTPSGNERDIDAPTNLQPTSTSQYIVVTYNNTTLAADLYTNAVLYASTVLPAASTFSYSPGTYGGASGTTENALGNDVYGDQQFGGAIYELRIWNGVVSQRYISASAILGSSNIVTNLTPTSASLSITTNVLIATDTEQSTVNVELSQTGTNAVLATADTTNWLSSNTNILQVNSSGLITGISPGTAKVIASIDGILLTSSNITVVPQVLEHRYSFITDASDSVGGPSWNGTLVPPTTGAAATINNGLVLPGSTVAGNGISGYVSLPGGILIGDSSITVECWATEAQHNTWSELWDFGNSGTQNFALIPYSGSGNTRVAFTPNGNENDINANALPTNSEQYVVATYNNFTLLGSFYTNGVLDATTTMPTTAYSPGAIGGAGGTVENMLGNDVYGDEQFDGTVYEFRIWNGAVAPLYVAVSAAAGPSVVVTNLTPSSLTVTVNSTNMIGAESQQAVVVGNFTVASGVTVTGGVTNWTSSNPGILTVSSTGLITAQNGGTATITATAGGLSATSPSITVALTAPVITQQPVGATEVAGQPVTFTVTAVGGNLSYQWEEGSTPIPGATNSTLTLTNLSVLESGGYSVVVSNALGSTNSTVVMLTVDQAILEHRYSFVSDASDSIGGPAWNGTLVAPSGGGTAAAIDNGLILPGNATGGTNVSGYVSLPNGIVAGDDSVTVECWVQPTAVNTWAEIWDFGSSGSQNFALIQDSPGPGNMRVAFTPNGGEVDIMAPTYLPATATPQYIVVTYNDETLVGELYTNGVLDASTTFPNNTYSPGAYGGAAGTTDNSFGRDVYNDPQFGGTIYEVRIWNGVVSQRYIAAATLLGSSNLVMNLTPTSVSVIVTNTMTAESTQQAAVTLLMAQTGTNALVATEDVTNWTSSNTGVLTVNGTGLITAVGGGTATISATVSGITGTASITVPFAAPEITVEPNATANVLTGGTLHATVVNIGVEPYTYTWYYNGSQAISGATGSTLTIPDLQAANDGSYTVVIHNAYGSVTSTPTVLTVVAPTAYQENLLALDPVGYWPLNETTGTTAYDLAGGYNGTYFGNVVLGQVTGPPNAGASANNYGAAFDGATAYVDIPGAPFNITNAVTAMAWVQLNAYTGFDGVFGHGDPSWRISVNPSGEPGANDGNLGSADATSSTSIVDGLWHLVAYTYTGDTSEANNGTLYVDGAIVAHDTITATPPGTNLDVWIAGAPDYPTARLLPGYVADAAVFDYALSAGDIQALYSGQTILGITQSGKNIVLTWSAGELLQAPTLLGPWTTNTTAVSPYTVATTSKAEFYKIQVNP
ncbi:MAG TPA: LamG-like jellyroll fold domain-containing protein [Verrucomicrobiae bacterium]|nr:LamG-like jellyroll fold domain-containing protein [Verrucomicrobiae bacterium]